MTMPVVKQSGALPESFSFVNTNSKNIVIDTVKKAEKSDDIIVRLYDAYDFNGDITLKFALPIKKAFLCDLLENEVSQLSINDNDIKLNVSNYEIVTLKLTV